MSGRAGTMPVPTRRKAGGRIAIAVGVVVVLAAMAIDTKVVKTGAPAATPNGAFSAAEYGTAEFPKVRTAILARAVDASVLAAALKKDPAAAIKEYGVDAGGASEMSVKFTGVVGSEDFGVYDVAVPGVPPDIKIKVQTGPAINGTDLRDATGAIKFGQFKNQIEYQNAGSAINKEMKRAVLSPIDTEKLGGKTIAVIGAFRLGDQTTWLVTPVQLGVQ